MNQNIQSDFELLDAIIDENPDLNESEILELFQNNSHHSNHSRIAVISENVSDCTGLLLDAAISSSKPENPQSQAKYQIGEKISTGGQSDVYLATRSDGTFEKTVVMKVLKHKFISTEDRHRFLNEIQILAALQHPNIVKIIDAGFNTNNEPWMVLEYIQGQHIDGYVTDNKPTLKTVIQVLIELTESLHHIHTKKIFHLDIKPSNIIINTDNNEAHPYLIDFGVSSIHSKEDLNTVTLGTLGFASPEQLHETDAPINHLSDIYSMGQLIKTVALQKDDKDLNSITNKCTAKYPHDRYANIHLLLMDLKKYRMRDPVSTRNLTIWQKFIRKFLKRPVINAMVLVLVISVIVLLAYSVTQKHKQTGLLIQQTKNSQYYWKSAGEIKNTTRLLSLRPTSNIQQELGELKLKYQQLEQQYQLENTLQKHAIGLSLAQAAISLGYYQKAQTVLLFLHQASAKDQDVNTTLARNYLDLYQLEVQKTTQFSNVNNRKSHIKKLKKRYLDPVRNLMKNLKLAEAKDDYLLKSMLLYFNGNIDEALEQLKHSEADELWPIPRMLFAMSITTEEARKFRVSGEQAQANLWYRKSHQMSQEALDISRSHPQLIQQRCTLKANIVATEIQTSEPFVTDKIQDCESSIALLKGSETGAVSTIYAYYNLARAQFILGQSPMYYLGRVESLIQTSDDLDKDLAQKYFILGQLNQIKGQWKMNSNQLSTTALNQAIQFHEKAAQLKPKLYVYQLEYANALHLYASSIQPFNKQADQIFNQSEQIMQDLLTHADATVLLSSNLLETLTNHSYFLYQNGIEADKQLTKAVQILAKMEQSWPNNFKVQQAKSTLTWTFADYLVYQNKNPEPYLTQAIESFDSIINIQSRNWIKRYNQISAMLSGITYYLKNTTTQTQQLRTVKSKLSELENIISKDIDLSSLYGYYYNMLAINTTLIQGDSQFAITQARLYNSHCINSAIDGYNCMTQFATLMKIEHLFDSLHNNFNLSKWLSDFKVLNNGLKTYPQHLQLVAQSALLKVNSIELLQLNPAQAQIILESAQVQLQLVFKNQPLLKRRFNNGMIQINHKLRAMMETN